MMIRHDRFELVILFTTGNQVGWISCSNVVVSIYIKKTLCWYSTNFSRINIIITLLDN
jgi:hypothetical protein